MKTSVGRRWRYIPLTIFIGLALSAGIDCSAEDALDQAIRSSIVTAASPAQAVTNGTRLLNEYSQSPAAVAKIHAAVAFSYGTQLIQPGIDKVIHECESALQGPLESGLRCKMFLLLGDYQQLKLRVVNFREADTVRTNALAAYLTGLKFVLDQTSSSNLSTREHLKWAETFKGSIEYLYEDTPFKEEVPTIGRALHLDAALLQELSKRLLIPDQPIVATPSPAPAVQTNLSFQTHEYEMDGTFVETNYSGQNQVRETYRADFKVFVKDCGWLIQTTEKNEAGTPIRREEIGSTNGVEIYDLVIDLSPPPTNPTSQATNENHPGRTSQHGLSLVTIVSNSVPVAAIDRPLISHLWLMLASICYFQNQTTNRLSPPYLYTAAVTGDPAITMEADWELMAGPGSLPKKVTYYNRGGYYDLAPTNSVLLDNGVSGQTIHPARTPGEEVIFTPYQGQFSSGFVDAVYTITGVRDVQGTAFPAGFTFDGFLPRGPTRYDLWASKHADVKVTAIRTECSHKSLLPSPAADERLVVNDYRLTRAQPPVPMFPYINPRDHWLSPAEAVERGHPIKIIHKEQAEKEFGVSIRSAVVGPNEVGIWFDFPPKGKLKNFRLVELDIADGGQKVVMTYLQPVKQTKDTVEVYFCTDPKYLSASKLTVNVPVDPQYSEGYQFSVQDFLKHDQSR